MKKPAHPLVDVLFVAAVLYGMATFFYMTPNPFTWSYAARFVVVSVPGVMAMIARLFMGDKEKPKAE